MKVNEILESITGKIEKSNLPKASIYIENSLYNIHTNSSTVLSDKTYNKPIVEIERHGQYVQMDLKLVSAFDNDIKTIWNTLNVFGSNANDTADDDPNDTDSRFASLTFVVTSNVIKDNSYMVASNPITWSLTAEKPGTNPNVIRLLFLIDDIYFFEGDESVRQNAIEEAKKERAVMQRNNSYYEQVENNRKQNEENE